MAIRASSVSPLAGDDLEHAVLLDPLGLDRDDPLAVLLRDRDLAGPVLAAGCRSCSSVVMRAVCGPQPLLGLDPGDLGLLAGPHRLDLALLLRLGVGLPALELEDGLAGASTFWRVISFSSSALELVGPHVLDRRSAR